MTRMTASEKQQFLAGLHVGVLSIPRPDSGPLTVPVWYDYRPGETLWFITGRDSRKGRLLATGTRVSLCAQTETPPYQYVTIEGPVTAIDPASDELLPMAVRYLGDKQGRAYAAGSSDDDSVVVHVRPEQWLAVDYGKSG
ncbi:MAG: pyridoxamine 5'-phosphate oxidase family protein [Pseudomonadales bacterium]